MGKASGERLLGKVGQEVQEQQGEARRKPAVTVLTLISWLQRRRRGCPILVCALLTQAGKTFVSSSEKGTNTAHHHPRH